MVKVIYPITPVPKPRMTKSDKWKQRECVIRYRSFADECRLRNVCIPSDGGRITFIIPMPSSWSQRKKDIYDKQAHTCKPDVDNLLKAVMDAIFPDDSHVWDVSVRKIWGREGAIIIE